MQGPSTMFFIRAKEFFPNSWNFQKLFNFPSGIVVNICDSRTGNKIYSLYYVGLQLLADLSFLTPNNNS